MKVMNMDLSPICLPMKWMFTTNFGVETLKITCMKAQVSLCLWGMCLWVLETNAIDVKLQAKKVKDPNVPQQEIPVHADPLAMPVSNKAKAIKIFFITI
jgi:hypothetical protein